MRTRGRRHCLRKAIRSKQSIDWKNFRADIDTYEPSLIARLPHSVGIVIFSIILTGLAKALPYSWAEQEQSIGLLQ
jgi:hypothetical protein